jgi:hypothetical protein
MYHNTLQSTKEKLWQDVIGFLEKNINDVKANNFKITKTTKIGYNKECEVKEMFDDILAEKIFDSYMPISYDEIVEWTKEEPMLIDSQIQPCFCGEDISILAMLKSNIANYLKIYIYKQTASWLTNLKNK